jgi:AdoMet-dependent heme synthase
VKTYFHSLYLETTRRCNSNCINCSTGSHPGISTTEELSFYEIKDLVLIPAKKLGTTLIEFSGGEFLLRSDALDILRLAADLGFDCAIATNCSTLDKEVLKNIREIFPKNNLLFSVGINSFDEDNSATRQQNYEETLQYIELLHEFEFRVNVSVTIGKFNKCSFGQTIERIKHLNVPYNRIPFVPRSFSETHSQMFDKQDMKEYFHPNLRKYFNGYISFVPFFLPQKEYEFLSGQNLEKDKIPLNPSVGCWVGAYYAISPEGNVSPCPMFQDHVIGGNIRQTALKKILYESEVFVKIVQRDKLKGKCGSCRYRYTCGGCRAMAYYDSKDYMGEDPTCFIDEVSEIELLGMEKVFSKNFKNYVRMCGFGGLYQPE